jgi:hypothetical protein
VAWSGCGFLGKRTLGFALLLEERGERREERKERKEREERRERRERKKEKVVSLHF